MKELLSFTSLALMISCVKLKRLNIVDILVRFLVLLISFSIGFGLRAQIPDKSHHDFGKVSEWNNPLAEFTITNNSNKKLVFLPIAYKPDLLVRIEKMSLEPGESCKIWVQYYTEKGGRFHEEIPIYVNLLQDPIQLSISGQIKSFSPEAMTVCPSMDQSATAGQISGIVHKIEVRDAVTDSLIPQFEIILLNHSGSYAAWEKHGVHEIRRFQPDLYEIETSSNGYEDDTRIIYLGQSSFLTIIYLNRESLDTIGEKEEQISDDTISEPEPVVYLDTTPEPDSLKPGSSNEDFVQGSLNPDKYKFNNIVFLIDVSGSMARDEKLSLLKYSMYQMIDVLRAEDRVSIITYSSEVEIHMSGVSGARKTELKDLIFSLNANGQSFGKEGMDRAFELAEEHFIEEGNNEVILASDGVFNSPGFSEKKIYRNVAKKFRKEQVRFTAIGFGNNPHALTFMKTMAHKGNGSFLRIENEEMARTVLITNIMNHSAKSEEGDWFMKE